MSRFLNQIRHSKLSMAALGLLATFIFGIYCFYATLLTIKIVLWIPNLGVILEKYGDLLEASMVAKVVALAFLFFVAKVLLYLKEKELGVFSMFEIVGGIFTIWLSFSQNHDNNMIYALTVGSGVFLLLNGLENLKKSDSKS